MKTIKFYKSNGEILCESILENNESTISERKEKFEDYLDKRVQNGELQIQNAKSYISQIDLFFNDLIQQKMMDNFSNTSNLLFMIADISCINTLYKTMNRSFPNYDEDYYQINRDNRSGQPSACISNYMNFLQGQEASIDNVGQFFNNEKTFWLIPTNIKSQHKFDAIERFSKEQTILFKTPLKNMKQGDLALIYVAHKHSIYIETKITNIDFEEDYFELELVKFLEHPITLQEMRFAGFASNSLTNRQELKKEFLHKLQDHLNNIKLIKAFKYRWNRENVENMTWEDYNQKNSDDTFVAWFEKIKIGEELKGGTHFGIGGQGEKKENLPSIKNTIITIIDAMTKKDKLESLNIIENINPSWLTNNKKWKYYYPRKLAFLYQDFELPCVVPIFTKEKLAQISHQESYAQQNLEIIKYYNINTLLDLYQFSLQRDMDNSLEKKISLNQILYGSPGTGKTYNTIDKALSILGFNNPQEDSQLDYQKIRNELKKLKSEKKIDISIDESNDRICAKALFDYYHSEGQIEFVTFHQNYGYEEFVEGIKPKLNDDKSDDLEYEIKDGIFKKICERAQKPEFENQDMLQKLEKAYKDYTAKLYRHPFSLLSANYINERPTLANIKDLIGNGEPIKQAKTQSDKTTFYVMTDTSNSIRVLANTESPSPMPLTYNEFIGSYCLGKKGTRFSYYGIFDEILKEANLDKDEAKQALSKQISNTKPYILIIDEINRGNVSKIFGELITLIEPSKRIGAEEELRVTLPYSGSQVENGETKELFGVPSNLYIIGTMNTADRSITSLDTALRRRFEFVEIMPDASKLRDMNIQGIDLEKLLQAINERIEFLYDREKTIGHAYLLDIKNLDDLKEKFQNKIIPLLQEYFYNDYEAINAVLNDNGIIQEKTYSKSEFFSNFISDRGLEEKKVFEIASNNAVDKDNKEVWNNPKTYIAIYDDKTAKELKKEKAEEK